MLLKVGHRGAMGYAPENTLLSFQKAMKLGVDMIELDVHVCKSGELVVIHDETVDRTTNGHGYIAEMNLQELQKLDAGKGEHIPTLREVLKFIDRKVKINIELKGKKTAQPTCKVIQEYVRDRLWQNDDFLVSSFDYDELKVCREPSLSIALGILISEQEFNYAEITKELGAKAVIPEYLLVNEKYVNDAHERGLQVMVWTVNEKNNIARMKQMGVDGIISNYPDRL